MKEKIKINRMEGWLLNWTAFAVNNTHAEIDGISHKDGGPEWYDKLFDLWEKNSDLGIQRKKLKEEEKNTISYRLDSEESKKLKEWQGHIKAIYGEYGEYVYSFESGGGIGVIKKVWSKLANAELDLTDVDKW